MREGKEGNISSILSPVQFAYIYISSYLFCSACIRVKLQTSVELPKVTELGLSGAIIWKLKPVCEMVMFKNFLFSYRIWSDAIKGSNERNCRQEQQGVSHRLFHYSPTPGRSMHSLACTVQFPARVIYARREFTLCNLISHTASHPRHWGVIS